MTESFALLLLLIGFVLLVFSLGVWWINRITESWPQTLATVLSKNIIYPPASRIGYHIAMEYEFEVNGKTYRSTNISKLFRSSYSYDKAMEEIERLSENPRVKYHPGNPDDCCLTSVPFGLLQWIFLLIGTICFAAGGFKLIDTYFIQ